MVWGPWEVGVFMEGPFRQQEVPATGWFSAHWRCSSLGDRDIKQPPSLWVQKIESMDGFLLGKSTGNHGFYHEIAWGFRFQLSPSSNCMIENWLPAFKIPIYCFCKGWTLDLLRSMKSPPKTTVYFCLWRHQTWRHGEHPRFCLMISPPDHPHVWPEIWATTNERPAEL